MFVRPPTINEDSSTWGKQRAWRHNCACSHWCGLDHHLAFPPCPILVSLYMTGCDSVTPFGLGLVLGWGSTRASPRSPSPQLLQAAGVVAGRNWVSYTVRHGQLSNLKVLAGLRRLMLDASLRGNISDELAQTLTANGTKV